jgi:hypothetical protein
MGAPVLAAALATAWGLSQLRTPDLAAQAYRAGLFVRDGFGVWDNNWYAGHHLPGYSLLFPPLAALLGMRIVGAVGAVASAVLFDRLARDHFGPRARWGILWFGAATATDLLIGRLTFGLGVALGLGALLALQRRRRWLAGVLAVLCAAASPVAGMFLALAGAAYALSARRWRAGALVALPGLALVGVLSVAFPEGGSQPFSPGAFWAALVFPALAIALMPRRERTLLVGTGLYALAVIASYALNTPMGGNVSRLGAMFCGPLLVCATAGLSAAELDGPARRLLSRLSGRLAGASGRLAGASGRLAGAPTVVVVVLLGAWQWNGPVREVVKGVSDDSVRLSYYRPLIDFLDRHREPLARVEVPFTLTHWDAAMLGRRFALARGWERQLDTKYDPLFYAHGPTPDSYRDWLRAAGVRYVALPDVRLDPSSRTEGQLIRSGLPFLRPVWHSAHWQVYELVGSQPLAAGAGRLTELGADDLRLDMRRPGWVWVRVHFTPYWHIAEGAGCVQRADGDWTMVRSDRPGPVRVVADFSLGRMFDQGPRCTAGARA